MSAASTASGAAAGTSAAGTTIFLLLMSLYHNIGTISKNQRNYEYINHLISPFPKKPDAFFSIFLK